MPDRTEGKQTSRFKPGQSGNPKGKPPGTRNAALVALDAIGADNASDILNAAVKAAKNGDMRAADVILTRVWPVRKGRPVPIEMPDTGTAQGVSNAMQYVTAALGAGTITPEEAHAMGAVLEQQRRAIETEELEKRLAALEAQMEEKK